MASSFDPRRKLAVMAEKHMRSGMHVRFLEECSAEGVVPKGLLLKLQVSVGDDTKNLQKSIDQLLHKVSLDICDRIKEEHLRKKINFEREIEALRKDIKSTSSDEQLSKLDSDIHTQLAQKQSKIIVQHQKKLTHLKSVQRDHSSSTYTVQRQRSSESHVQSSNNGNIPQECDASVSRDNLNLTEDAECEGDFILVSRRKKPRRPVQVRADAKSNRAQLAYKPRGKIAKTLNKTQIRQPQQNIERNTTAIGSSRTRRPDKHASSTVNRTIPKNASAPGTKKTYSEATRSGATQSVNNTSLQNHLQALLLTVQNIVTAALGQNGNQDGSSALKTATSGGSGKSGNVRSRGGNQRY